MRHGRTAKQRLWLGAIGHFCGCQRRLTNPDSNSNRHCHCYSYGDCHRNSYSFAYTHSDGDAVRGKMFPDAQAASNTCAEAIRRDFLAIS